MSMINRFFNKKEKIAEIKRSFKNEHNNIHPVLIDLVAFNHNLQKHFQKQYNIDQMEGISLIITKFFEAGFTSREWLAYILATSWHETAFTMRPVIEYGSEKYLREKPYWPYYGRGFVQITHKENYEKYGIADNPDMALDPELACYILIHGMTEGIFTGRKLKHYFNQGVSDPFNARKIINGLDRAARIVEYHNNFMKVLELSSFEV